MTKLSLLLVLILSSSLQSAVKLDKLVLNSGDFETKNDQFNLTGEAIQKIERYFTTKEDTVKTDRVKNSLVRVSQVSFNQGREQAFQEFKNSSDNASDHLTKKLEAQITSLKTANTELTQRLDIQGIEMKKLTQERNDLSNRLTEAQAALETAKTQREGLSAQLKTVNSDVETLKASQNQQPKPAPAQPKENKSRPENQSWIGFTYKSFMALSIRGKLFFMLLALPIIATNIIGVYSLGTYVRS